LVSGKKKGRFHRYLRVQGKVPRVSPRSNFEGCGGLGGKEEEGEGKPCPDKNALTKGLTISLSRDVRVRAVHPEGRKKKKKKNSPADHRENGNLKRALSPAWAVG